MNIYVKILLTHLNLSEWQVGYIVQAFKCDVLLHLVLMANQPMKKYSMVFENEEKRDVQ